MYHAKSTDRALTLRTGICLCFDAATARHYGPHVWAIEIADEMLESAVEAPAYDRDTDTAPGDSLGRGGALVSDWDEIDDHDVIEFDDESPCGRRHRTVRLLTDAALEAVTGFERL